jgi:hypothetical protein
MGTTIIMVMVMEYMDEWFNQCTEGSTRVLDVTDDKDVDDDDDEDGDDEDGDDDLVPLAMGEIPSFSSLILPPDGLRWLGFNFLDEFLESLHI